MKLKLDENGAAVLEDGKPVYVHDDGKEIAFDAPATVARISALNAEAKSHRERAEAAESTLKTFEGIEDPAAAIKAMATVKNLDDKKLVDAGEVEKVKAEAIKAVRAEFEPVTKERDQLQGQLDELLIGGAFSQSKFIADNFAAEGLAGVDMARALFGRQLKVEKGAIVGYDAQGNKLFSRQNPGELAGPDEAIEMIVEAYPHKGQLLKGSGASGGGAHPGSGGGGSAKTISRQAFEALSPADRAARVKDGVTVTDQ